MIKKGGLKYFGRGDGKRLVCVTKTVKSAVTRGEHSMCWAAYSGEPSGYVVQRGENEGRWGEVESMVCGCSNVARVVSVCVCV